uniref:AMP-binding protein n=1 Tax=Streptomyces sp. DSM 41033 TaxID=3448655 RepID=UPI00404001B3
PMDFLRDTLLWAKLITKYKGTMTAAPNFAFDLAARKTKDADLAGLDLGGVAGIINGAERVEPATLERFADRFAHFNFREHMLRPSYGLAEATVFVATGTWSESSEVAQFDVDELAAGRVRRCAAGTGSALVKYSLPQSPMVRIVDV